MIYIFRSVAVLLVIAALALNVAVFSLPPHGEGAEGAIMTALIVAFCFPILWHDSSK